MSSILRRRSWPASHTTMADMLVALVVFTGASTAVWCGYSKYIEKQRHVGAPALRPPHCRERMGLTVYQFPSNAEKGPWAEGAAGPAEGGTEQAEFRGTADASDRQRDPRETNHHSFPWWSRRPPPLPPADGTLGRRAAVCASILCFKRSILCLKVNDMALARNVDSKDKASRGRPTCLESRGIRVC